jgi:chemosensory pili system protein ChpA (sensor histidine kinase/response regulator)
LSRRLATELAEWTHEPTGGRNAVALAHSLAGNSATVGFSDLSQLARSLEYALMRSMRVARVRRGRSSTLRRAKKFAVCCISSLPAS